MGFFDKILGKQEVVVEPTVGIGEAKPELMTIDGLISGYLSLAKQENEIAAKKAVIKAEIDLFAKGYFEGKQAGTFQSVDGFVKMAQNPPRVFYVENGKSLSLSERSELASKPFLRGFVHRDISTLKIMSAANDESVQVIKQLNTRGVAIEQAIRYDVKAFKAP